MLNDVEKFMTQRHLNVVFQSIGQPVEVMLLDGSFGHGIFFGFTIEKKAFKFKNFCFFHSEILELEKILHLNQINFVHVLQITINKPQLDLIKSSSENSIKLKSDKNQRSSAIEHKIVKKNEDSLNEDYNFKKKLRQKKEQEKGSELLRLITPSPSDFQAAQKNKNQDFALDFEISKKRKGNSPKVFQKFDLKNNKNWGELESETNIGFDQFAINKKKFQIESEFNENEYSTFLDINSVPFEVRKKAKRLEEEIKNSILPINSRHVKEERGELDLLDNENEELAYSSVVRTKNVENEKIPQQIKHIEEFKTGEVKKQDENDHSPMFILKPLKFNSAEEANFRRMIEVNFESNGRRVSELIESISIGSDRHRGNPQIVSLKDSELSYHHHKSFHKNGESHKRKSPHFRNVG